MACEVTTNCIVEMEGLLKVRGSHVHLKKVIMSEMVLNRDVITTAHTIEK